MGSPVEGSRIVGTAPHACVSQRAAHVNIRTAPRCSDRYKVRRRHECAVSACHARSACRLRPPPRPTEAGASHPSSIHAWFEAQGHASGELIDSAAAATRASPGRARCSRSSGARCGLHRRRDAARTAKTPTSLRAAIAPWLAEARRTRRARLRHGPDGRPPLDQRSCIVAPLVAGRSVLGYLYADIDGATGRFDNADRDRLAALAAAGCGRRGRHLLESRAIRSELAERSADLARRNAELAVINSIQQAVGAALDFQAIVDVVGDKLREVFATGDMSIRWWDEAAGALSSLYSYEHGLRLPKGGFKPEPGTVVHRFVHEGRRPFVFGSVAEQLAAGHPVAAGTDRSRSLVIVPMLAGERLLGAVILENHERDNAFGPADVSLLQTVAGSTWARRSVQREELRGRAAARRRARGHQRHPGRHGRRARLPGHRRPRRRQAASGCSRPTPWSSAGWTSRPGCFRSCTGSSAPSGSA